MPAYKDKERNTWFCVYTQTVNGVSRQKKKRGFPTKRDALLWEAEMKRSDSKFTLHTFAEMLEEYMLSIDSSETSSNMKRNWCMKHFEYFSEPIEKISRQQLMEWRNALKSTGMATRTMNRGLGYVRGVFAYANKIYRIEDVSVVINNYKLTSEDKKEMKVWTPAQFAQFQEHCDPAYLPYFTFLYWTGCRRSEALAVCKEDVQGNKVSINKTIKHFKNGFLPLKNDASKRIITVDDRTLSLMDLEHANPFVFGEDRSLPITCIQREFKKATEAAGLPPIRIHDLRHSHATVLINNGANIVAISKRLGHASINETLKTYSHLLQKSDDELMDIIKEIR